MNDVLSIYLKYDENVNNSSLLPLLREYDEELDDINSLLMDLCEIIQDTQEVQFVVSGFGQDFWSVDVWVDLATILEQLPSIFDCIRSKEKVFELDFYEQGVQRRLICEKMKSDYHIKYYSSTNWIPNPSLIVIDCKDLESQLINLQKDFVSISTTLYPQLSTNLWFIDWKNTSNRL